MTQETTPACAASIQASLQAHQSYCLSMKLFTDFVRTILSRKAAQDGRLELLSDKCKPVEDKQLLEDYVFQLYGRELRMRLRKTTIEGVGEDEATGAIDVSVLRTTVSADPKSENHSKVTTVWLSEEGFANTSRCGPPKPSAPNLKDSESCVALFLSLVVSALEV